MGSFTAQQAFDREVTSGGFDSAELLDSAGLPGCVVIVYIAHGEDVGHGLGCSWQTRYAVYTHEGSAKVSGVLDSGFIKDE